MKIICNMTIWGIHRTQKMEMIYFKTDERRGSLTAKNIWMNDNEIINAKDMPQHYQREDIRDEESDNEFLEKR